MIDIFFTVERMIDERWLRQDTHRYYRQTAHRWVEDMQLHDLSEITTDLVVQWRKKVADRGCSASTLNTYHRGMRAILNFAREKRLVETNPFEEVKLIHIGRRIKKTLPPSLLDDAIRILSNWGDDGYFWCLVVKVLYYTGIRRQQLPGIKWGDLNEVDGALSIRASTSKTDREWFVPLDDDLLQELLEFRVMTNNRLHREVKHDEQMFRVQLWNNRYAGNELSRSQVSGFFRRLSEKQGVAISSHRFRHTFATHLVRHDLKSAQEILGHTNIRTTMDYVYPELDQMKELVKKLPRL